MVLTSITKRPGDLFIAGDIQYCTKTVIIRNGTATQRTLDNIVGYPLKAGASGADYQLAVAGDEANVLALLLDCDGQYSETIAATTNSSRKYQALKNAPCIINRNAIRTLDIAGAAFDVAAIVAALEALKWEVRSEPSISQTL